jgi:hypothetical protein
MLSELRPHFVTLSLPPDFSVADEATLSEMRREIMLDVVNDFFDEGESEFLRLADTLAGARDEEMLDEALLYVWDKLMCFGKNAEFLLSDTYEGDFLLSPPMEALRHELDIMSRHFADILAENHDIPDHRNDGETAAEYNAKLGLYDAEVAAAAANRPDVPPRPQEAVKPSVPAEEKVPVDTEPAEVTEIPVQSGKTDVVVADGTFAYTYRGTPLVPGEVFDAGKLPKPMATTTIPSCAFSGTDNVYTYDSIEVVAYDEGQGEHLYSIYLLDPNTPTDEGLMLGDSVERMVELYGEDYTQTGSEYAYYRGDTILIVLAPGNTINSIEIRMAG